MHVAEPRYTVPCRKTIMGLIDQKYQVLKEQIGNQVAQQSCLSLTMDMWTSRVGDGYISLTAHYITDDFELCHHNLSTCHFPGSHKCTCLSCASHCVSNRGDEFKIVELEAEPEEEAAVVEYCTSPKKQKITLLEKLLGKKFESTPSTVAISENEIVQAEISYYKSASPISLRDKPLDWWNKQKHLLQSWPKSIWALYAF